MKNYLIMFIFLIFPFISFSQNERDSAGFFFESSKNNPFQTPSIEWQFDKGYAIKRIGYWRGSPCGDVPKTERVIGKMRNDTIFINYNKKRVPLCDPRIGIAGNAIDLVINIEKYPNYNDIVLTEVKTENCKTDSCFINNVDDILNKPFIEKKEITINEDWAGGYEMYTVYYDYNEPILIEKNQKFVVRYRTYQGEKDIPTYVSAKFYIKNWKNKEFIRIGEIKNPLKNEYYEIIKYETVKMGSSYKFEFDEKLIDNLLINKRKSR